MKRITFYASILFLLQACTNDSLRVTSKEDSTVQTNSQKPDTTIATLDTIQKNTGIPEGIYQVTLPCTDCKGIEHTVSFDPDLTYHLEEARMGKTTEITTNEGHWRIQDEKIILYKGQTPIATYSWQGNNLVYERSMGETLALHRLPSAGDIEVWRNKKNKGVEFFGVGNEPFWNVEIDEQQSIIFQLADWSKPQQYKPVTPMSSTDSSVYNTSNGSSNLRVTIYNQFCSDGMSDNMYNHRVSVNYNGTIYNGCGILFK
jgi:uncharacterized membrane protein